MKYLLFFGILALAAAAFWAFKGQGKYKTSLETFNQGLQTSESKILLDCRTAKEYASGHLEGSINIDFFKGSFESEVKKLSTSQPIFIYCASGNRSGKACNALEKAGFTKIHDLAGGISAWKASGLKIVTQ